MRSFRPVRATAALALLVLGSVVRAQDASTPLSLAIDGTLTQPGTVLPWPADPTMKLALDDHVRTTVTASSSAADADAELLEYFTAATDATGFAVTDATAGPVLLGWKGRWTNRAGFLLDGAFAGQRTGVVSQTPPVISLAGTAEIQGLSGRGRGIVLKGNWTGQLNTQTGALRLALTGLAVGDLGPFPPVCGDYTDEGLAGDLVPLMTHDDGTPNQNHFSHDADDPYPHPFHYSTNPPTSGPHNPSPLPWGIYDTPQDDESIVHNLEHGGVIVSYHPSLAPAIIARLRALVGLYPEDVILAPRPANDVPIALTSWGHLQKFTEYDEPAIQNFVDRNRAHGPECFH
jgi:Protein of unknown function (DUF3105)